MTTPADVVALANSQAGKPYVWGAKPTATETNPTGFDCSGFTNWVCERLGLPSLGRLGGTWAAKAACTAAKTLIPVDQALKMPGALLGMDYPNEQHIAFSRGDGTTAEARGVAYGVGSWTAIGRAWNWAALVPGLSYAQPVAPPATPPTFTEDPDMMMVLVPNHAGDAAGRAPVWQTDKDGNLYCWNGAPQLRSLSAFTTNHPPICAILAIPDGSGVILVGDDVHQDGAEWVRSTYKITV